MATIEILSWKENFVGGTAWDAHAKSELRKRLRRGLAASPHEIRRRAREIEKRQVVCLRDVRDDMVMTVTQMLQTMGANVRVSVEDGNNEGLFKKLPKRGPSWNTEQ